jgi:outer membrane protein assembly factor BamA
LALLSAFVSAGARADEASPPAALISAMAPIPAPKPWDIAALPIVYYQPETLFGVGGQVVLVRGVTTGGPDGERHDSIGFAATATQRHQYAVDLNGTKFWDRDHDRMQLDISAQKFPNTFWGLGNNTPPSAADQYTPIAAGVQARYSHRVVERIFLGVAGGIGYYRMESFNPVGSVADYLATSRQQGRLVGIGPTLVRDSRDDDASPRAGSQTSITVTMFRQAWLSDYHYVELEADHHAFLGLPHRMVLALQAYGQLFVGEPPIDLLPALGGSGLLRGYFQGRYRDKVYLAGQSEIRVPLFWRFGGVVFAAVGNVFPSLASVDLDHAKEAGGLGLRLNVGSSNPVNIRLDGAIAPGSTGVYLTIGEAI